MLRAKSRSVSTRAIPCITTPRGEESSEEMSSEEMSSEESAVRERRLINQNTITVKNGILTIHQWKEPAKRKSTTPPTPAGMTKAWMPALMMRGSSSRPSIEARRPGLALRLVMSSRSVPRGSTKAFTSSIDARDLAER